MSALDNLIDLASERRGFDSSILDEAIKELSQLRNILYSDSSTKSSRKVVDFLNAAWDADPVAMRMMLVNLVRVNNRIAFDTAIVCQKFEGEYAMSALGLINGILDVLGLPLVASRLSDADIDLGDRQEKQFIGFQIYDHDPEG